MTISSENRKAGPYTGNGVTTSFPFSFKVFTAADLLVVRTNLSGVESTLALTTDYTVTLSQDQNTNPGGTITLVAGALTSGFKLTATSQVGNTQGTDLTNQGGFYPNVINNALDKLTILVQQLKLLIGRTVTFPLSDPSGINTQLPTVANRANKVLTFDDDGAPSASIGAVDVTTVAGIASEIVTVSGIAAEVEAVAAVDAEVVTVAGIAANVTTVAGISIAVSTVAANITDIQNAEENADAAAASATLANEWATKTSGPVAGGEYSAKYHAQLAATAKANAETAETNAEAAQAAAESARDATLAAYDQFDDRYLGTKTSDPTVDNDGNPLVAGALYFNSVSGIMKLYTGSAWVAAYVQGVASSIGVTPSGGISATNVQSALEELDSEKIATSAIGSTVQAYDANTAKLNVVQAFSKAQRGTAVALTSTSASIATDASLANNFTHTFTENTTLANPTNLVAGQSGVIVFTQHASSPKTLAFGSNWKFSSGTIPSVTASNSAVDVLAYFVESSTRITAKLVTDVK